MVEMNDDFSSLDLSHLTSFGQKIVLLPTTERLQKIRSDHWIGYPYALDTLSQLEDLLTWPLKQRMPNLLIVGPTNNGKSMIIEKFRRTHAPMSEEDRERIPVLSVQMPSEPSPSRFYTSLLAALGAPLRPRERLAELEHRSLKLLRAVGVRLLVIDELHNILAGKGSTQREFLNLIRFLGNELRLPLIGVGTYEAYLAIRSDSQLENRFEPIVLPLWEEGENFYSLLTSFMMALPLRRRSFISTPHMARYLLTKSEGTIGELTSLLTSAAIAAVESGEEQINQRTLTLCGYVGPTERKKIFERELR